MTPETSPDGRTSCPAVFVRRRRGAWLIVALAALAFVGLAGWRLDAPWTRGHEGNAGLQYGAIIRHWQEHGFSDLRMAQVRVPDPLPREELLAEDRLRSEHLRERYGILFWTSRLPLGALVQATGPALFGLSNWSMRLVPLVTALAVGLLLFAGLARALGATAAGLVAAAFLLNPAVVVIARQPGYEWPCLLAVVATLLLYARLGKAGHREDAAASASEDCVALVASPSCAADVRNRRGWLVCAAAAVAGLLGWFGLYAVPILLVTELRSRRLAPVVRWGLLLVPVAVVALYALYLAELDQSLGERLQYYWQVRGAGALFADKAKASLTLPDYLHTVQKHLVNHITPLPLLLAGVWVVGWVRARRRGEVRPEATLVGMLLAFALLCYLLTLRGSYKHRFYVMWWTPALAVAGGAMLGRWWEQKRRLLVAALLLLLLTSAVYKTIGHHRKSAGDPPLTDVAG